MRKETIGRKHGRTRTCAERFAFVLLADTPVETERRPWLSDTDDLRRRIDPAVDELGSARGLVAFRVDPCGTDWTGEHAVLPMGATGAGFSASIYVDPCCLVEVR